MAKKDTPNGYVIYEGPSELDGAPIVVVATGFKSGSNNAKTGAGLIQTWIIRSDVAPTDAVNSGADASVCGGCIHRGTVVDGKNVGRSCYVTVFQAPLNVFRTYHRGRYPKVAPADLPALFAGKGLRLGSYGDPAAAPLWVWQKATTHVAFKAGYTHQWRQFPELAQWCMASADSLADRAAAKLLGFRTFRVTLAADKAVGEVVCPASEEAGKKTTCDQCRACGGLTAKAKADIVIRIHGAAPKVKAARARVMDDIEELKAAVRDYVNASAA